MAIIKTKVSNFTGYRASVYFKNGVAETDREDLITWFKTHGYIVEDKACEDIDDTQLDIETMTFDELKNLAKSEGIFIGNTKDPDKLKAKLKEVM